MKDELKTAFSAYLTKVITVIGSKKTFTEKRKTNDSKDCLVKRITKLEQSSEFLNLVSTSSVTFGGKTIKRLDDCFPQRCMENFLRRSGCYISIWENSFSDINNYFDFLWDSYNKKKFHITTFRALNVYFPEDLIDFDDFKIQRLSQKEWVSFSQNKINWIFYPDAVVDSKKLSQFWFIKEEKPVDKKRVSFGKIDFDLGPDMDDAWEGKVNNKFPDSTLQLLALYNWNAFSRLEFPEQKAEDKDWLGFSITDPLIITNDLLSTPHHTSLNLPFVLDITTDQFYDQETGEEVAENIESENPDYAIDEVTEDELREIKDLIKKAKDLSKIRPEKWRFLDIAMEYLAKAFFAEGVEQLLWHIIVLEALFGENGQSISKKLGKRISIVLKNDGIRDQFKKLYKLRSELVHGNSQQKQVYRYHLWQARDLSRRSVVWFLNYLLILYGKLDSKNIPIENFPTREEILYSIEIEKSQKKRLNFLFENLPEV